jgi:polyphosphate kinase
MQPDGSYIRETGGEGTSSQELLYRYFSEYKVEPEAAKAEEPAASAAAPEPAPSAEPGLFTRFKNWLSRIFS